MTAMKDVRITASSQVTEAEVKSARMGTRFGRLDAMSQLALVAVEALGINFDTPPRDRIGICLAARAGSLSTDVEFWNGRDAAGGPSPTLFAYTLPSAAIGEIAIRYRLRGPNLCFVGDETVALPEATDLVRRGEADACVCVVCDAVSSAAATAIQSSPTARARAWLLASSALGLAGRACDAPGDTSK